MCSIAQVNLNSTPFVASIFNSNNANWIQADPLSAPKGTKLKHTYWKKSLDVYDSAINSGNINYRQGSGRWLSEEDWGARRESFLLENFDELLNSLSFRFSICAHWFPESHTILRHLLRVLSTRQREYHCNLCKFLIRPCNIKASQIIMTNCSIHPTISAKSEHDHAWGSYGWTADRVRRQAKIWWPWTIATSAQDLAGVPLQG